MPSTDLTRRAVLAGGATAALGLAGCAASTPPTPAPSATPPAAAGSAGTTLGAASDVPVGGATVFEALEVVVTQPVAGAFTGLSAVCTHTGCIVNRVEGATIVCPCHGSRYRLDGSVETGPAPRALDPRPVTVVDGQLMLA